MSACKTVICTTGCVTNLELFKEFVSMDYGGTTTVKWSSAFGVGTGGLRLESRQFFFCRKIITDRESVKKAVIVAAAVISRTAAIFDEA